MNIDSHGLNASSDATTSGESWGSAFAGSAAAGGLALILVMLGSELGFSTILPGYDESVGASVTGVSTILWLILTQIAASGVGGYIAGRLRKAWKTAPSDEDHRGGDLAGWTAAALIVAAALYMTIDNADSNGTSAVAPAASGIDSNPIEVTTGGERVTSSSSATPDRGRDEAESDYIDHTADSRGQPVPPITYGGSETRIGNRVENNAVRLEIAGIFTNALRTNSFSRADQQRLAQLVSKRTGLSYADASKRVSDAFFKAQALILSPRFPQATQSSRDRLLL